MLLKVHNIQLHISFVAENDGADEFFCPHETLLLVDVKDERDGREDGQTADDCEDLVGCRHQSCHTRNKKI